MKWGLLWFGLVSITSSQADPVDSKLSWFFPMAAFEAGFPKGIETQTFQNQTRYQYQKFLGQDALHARADSSASGLVRQHRQDLDNKPILNWSWAISEYGPELEETQKTEEDFIARLYVVKKSRLTPWRSHSLVYVWSSSLPAHSHWSSPYSGNIHFVVVADTSFSLSKWHSFQRDVRKDFETYLNKDISHIDAVAIMTDSDNSGVTLQAWYGDVFFSPS